MCMQKPRKIRGIRQIPKRYLARVETVFGPSRNGICSIPKRFFQNGIGRKPRKTHGIRQIPFRYGQDTKTVRAKYRFGICQIPRKLR